MTTPTQRTLAALEKNGFRAAVTERWNPYVPRPDGGQGIRQDLWGWMDVLAVHPRLKTTLGIQVTANSGATRRLDKLLADSNRTIAHWLQAGNRCLLWTWGQYVQGKKGGGTCKIKRWRPTIKELHWTPGGSIEFMVRSVVEGRDPGKLELVQCLSTST